MAAESVLQHVGHVHHRLQGEQEQVADQRFLFIVQAQRTAGLAVVEAGLQLLQHGLAGDRVLLARLGGTLGAVQRLLHAFQIGQRQLGVDGVDVRDRVDPVVDVDDVVVLEAADHVGDRIHFPDMRQELVAQAFTTGRAGHQACDIDEFHGSRDDLLRLDDFSELIEAQVRHRHNAHVRLDGAEREVGRGDARLGKRIEQGGLADVRQADDAAFDAHIVNPSR
jgi:hypothetical protein